MVRSFLIGLAALFFAASAARADCPTPFGEPYFGTVELASGFSPDPRVERLTAGGSNALRSCPAIPGIGFVGRRPDLRLVYDSDGRTALTIVGAALVDSILLVNAPNGQWFWNDDGGGNYGGAVRFPNALTGTYNIWLGTYEQASGISGLIQISEQF